MLKDVFKIIFFIVWGSSLALAQDQIRLGNSVIINWWHGYESGAILSVSDLDKFEGFGYTFFKLKNFASDPSVIKKIATIHEQTGCEVHLEVNLHGSPIDRTRLDVTWFEYHSSWEMRGYDGLGKPVHYSIPISDYPLHEYQGEPQFEQGNLSVSLDGFLNYTNSYNPKCIFVPEISYTDDKKNQNNEEEQNIKSSDQSDETESKDKLNKILANDSKLKQLNVELTKIKKKISESELITKTLDKNVIEIARTVKQTGKCPTTNAEYNYLKKTHETWFRNGLYHSTPMEELKSNDNDQAIFCGLQNNRFSKQLEWHEGQVRLLANETIMETLPWASTAKTYYYYFAPQNDIYVFFQDTIEGDRSYRDKGMMGDAVYFKIADGFFSSGTGFIKDKKDMRDRGFYLNYLIFTSKFFQNEFPEIAPTQELKLKKAEIEKKINQRTKEIQKSLED